MYILDYIRNNKAVHKNILMYNMEVHSFFTLIIVCILIEKDF